MGTDYQSIHRGAGHRLGWFRGAVLCWAAYLFCGCVTVDKPKISATANILPKISEIKEEIAIESEFNGARFRELYNKTIVNHNQTLPFLIIIMVLIALLCFLVLGSR